METIRRASFEVSPNDTDVVSTAEAANNALTLRQRALTVAEVLKRPELWPYQLHLKASFDIGRQRFRKGDAVDLMAVEKNHTELKPGDTDLLEQARKYLETGAPGRVAEELKGKLIDPQTGRQRPVDPQKTKYYVFYHAARWCPFSQKFTPQLLIDQYGNIVLDNAEVDRDTALVRLRQMLK